MTHQLFTVFTTVGAEWVMYLLIGLSVLSVAVMLERLVFFLRFSYPRSAELLPLLSQGRFDEARAALEDRRGIEVAVARAALDAAPGGPASVEQVAACIVAREKPAYERFLSFLGTLGNNAPFIGLFGTVIGIIKAFADLAVGGANSAGAAAVMAGISEALVATAIGIFVAIPAVVAFNAYTRWLKTLVGRTQALAHAITSHLEKDAIRQAALAKARRTETAHHPQVSTFRVA